MGWKTCNGVGEVASLEHVEDGRLAEGERVVEGAALARRIARHAVLLAHSAPKAPRRHRPVLLGTRAIERGPVGQGRPLLGHGQVWNKTK